MKTGLLINHQKRHGSPGVFQKAHLLALLLLAAPMLAKAEKTNYTLTARPVARIITGKVTDEKSEGIPGVNILVKGTQRGTSTGVDGSFSIDAGENNAILVFSSVGYLSQEIETGSQNSLSVILKNDEKALDELVVVGYGVQKKSSITGAVSVITSKTLEDRPVTNTLAALQGAAPGPGDHAVNWTAGQGRLVGSDPEFYFGKWVKPAYFGRWG